MSQAKNISKTRVLVVDDNLLNRKLVCAILKNHDLDFDIAENGKIALDLFLTHKYDLVLMDIQMPIMNGIDCTCRIRKYERESNIQSPIPIIAVTAFAMDNDKENCFNAGMNEFIAKPFRAENLVDLMSKYIKLKSIA